MKLFGTKLTLENLLAWANQQATDHPEIPIKVRGEDGVERDDVEPNTAKHELVEILQRWQFRNYSDSSYSRYELVSVVMDMLREGVVGYDKLTAEELAFEILKEICGEDSSDDFEDLEDLLEAYGPDATRDYGDLEPEEGPT